MLQVYSAGLADAVVQYLPLLPTGYKFETEHGQ